MKSQRMCTKESCQREEQKKNNNGKVCNIENSESLPAHTYIPYTLSNFPSALQLNQSEKCFTFLFFLDFPFFALNTHWRMLKSSSGEANGKPKSFESQSRHFTETDRWQMATVNLCVCST